MAAPVSVRRAIAQSGLIPVDAQVLLGHVLGRNRAWLAAHGEDALTADEATQFFVLARRRRDGEPVAYLTGIREFHGLPLRVTRAVLIPRPETETVVEVALAHLPMDRDTRVLDLGTGSGAIALAIAHSRPRARVLATDTSKAALELASDNARRLDIANVTFIESDWYANVPTAENARFDVIASNPPYVDAADAHLDAGDLRFEPRLALTPGDALAALRRVIDGARTHLAAGGVLVVEHGFDQAEAVRALFITAGFVETMSTRDLAGIPRVVSGRR
jgi:release factor glutamine methyltransferase